MQFIKTRFARVNSDDPQHIFLLWRQILVLKFTVPGCPNSRLYVLPEGITPVDFSIMCELCLFRPFYAQIGAFGWREMVKPNMTIKVQLVLSGPAHPNAPIWA